MYCRRCGAQNDDGKRFCTSCGAPLAGEAAPAQAPNASRTNNYVDGAVAGHAGGEGPGVSPDAIACPACGAPNKPTRAFCTACGQPLAPGPDPEPRPPRRHVGALVAVAIALLLCLCGGVLYAGNGIGWWSLDLPFSKPAQDDEEPAKDDDAKGGETGQQEVPSDDADGPDATDSQEEDDDTEQPSSPIAGIPVRASLNDYTWAELKEISGAIADSGSKDAGIALAAQYNLCDETGSLVGMGRKEVTLTDGMTCHVSIVGIRQDATPEGAAAGLTFLFDEAVSFYTWNSSDFNSNGWESSNLRTYVLNDLAALLPSDLLDQTLPVVKLSNNFGGSQSGTLPTSIVTETVDRLWVPSYVELAGSSEANELWGPSYGTAEYAWCNPIVAAEGTQYDLFSQLGIAAYRPNQSLVRRFDGSSTSWWLRSANPHLVNDSLCVDSDGDPSIDATPRNRLGVVPGFCI